MTPKEAADHSLRFKGHKKPTAIADYSNNPGAGNYGDATNLLKALLEAGVQEACFRAVCDPDAVKSIVDAGVVSNVEVEVGGKNNPELGGGPLGPKGEVMGIFQWRLSLRRTNVCWFSKEVWSDCSSSREWD